MVINRQIVPNWYKTQRGNLYLTMTSKNLALPIKKERIQYIDALRGFTMLLVVFAHIETFGFYGAGESCTFLGKIFITFRMPLFFFISGFISHKANYEFTLQAALCLAWRKLLVQLLPTIIFGISYTCLYLNYNIYDFWVNSDKYGYWFTISLLEMFLVYYFIRTISYYWKKKFPKSIELYPFLLLLVAAAMFVTKCSFTGEFWGELSNIACLHHTFRYFHFFVIGICASKFNEIFMALINNKYVLTLLIVLFLVSCTFENDILRWGGYDTLYEIVPRYTGLFVVYAFFYKYRDSFSITSPLGASLQYVGQRTLDVYMLHFFFIPCLISVR